MTKGLYFYFNHQFNNWSFFNCHLAFLGSDAGEIEKLRSWKMELEAAITALDEGVKSIQAELRLLEDEAAKLHKQRVC